MLPDHDHDHDRAGEIGAYRQWETKDPSPTC